MRTVVALYDRFEDAQQAVRALRDAGYNQNDINMVARDASGEYSRYLENNREGAQEQIHDGAATGAGIGAVLGGLGGLLLGLGALAIPGIGPVIAAGPIVTALAGAGVGAVAGGVVGALVDMGIPEEHANLYAEGIRRGGTLVVVRTQDNQAEQARMLLNRFSPVDIENRAGNWRQNQWTGFSTTGQPLSAEEMEFNRTNAAMPVTGGDVNRNIHQGPMGDQSGTETSFDQNQDQMNDRSVRGDMNSPRSMSDVDENRLGTRDMTDQQSGTGSGNIPITGRPQQSDSHMTDEFDSGMNEHLTEDVYGSEHSHETMADIPVTGGPMDVEEVDIVDVAPNTNTGWDGYDTFFQRDFQSRYGSSGYAYADYQPAYRYGYDLAHNPNYQNYDWEMIEPSARQEWERRGLRGAWDDMKGAVRRAWETVINH